jgi:hypothetical protein
MALIDSKTLVFLPDHQSFAIRDYEMYDQPGQPEAIAEAAKHAVSASAYGIFVSCAQDSLKINLTVSVYDEPVRADGTWERQDTFTVPFPTARLYAGDGFGHAIEVTLPHNGVYTVTLRCSGRDQATIRLRDVLPLAVQMPAEPMRQYLDQWAGLENYDVIVFPERPSHA